MDLAKYINKYNNLKNTNLVDFMVECVDNADDVELHTKNILVLNFTEIINILGDFSEKSLSELIGENESIISGIDHIKAFIEILCFTQLDLYKDMYITGITEILIESTNNILPDIQAIYGDKLIEEYAEKMVDFFSSKNLYDKWLVKFSTINGIGNDGILFLLPIRWKKVNTYENNRSLENHLEILAIHKINKG